MAEPPLRCKPPAGSSGLQGSRDGAGGSRGRGALPGAAPRLASAPLGQGAAGALLGVAA